MNKKYILTSIFENKYGKAKKYFNGKTWHWMLNSDKPKLFDAKEEAEKIVPLFRGQLEEEAEIMEINVFNNVWEHKVSQEDNADFFQVVNAPKDVIFEMEQRKHFLFLSTIKQHPTAELLEGLYCTDRKTDTWIYCHIPTNESKESPEKYIYQSYKKIEEAKALMIIFDYSEAEVKKVEGVMTFVQKIMKEVEIEDESDEMEENPKVLIEKAYQYLDKAKQNMIQKNYDKQELSKLEGVMMFVKRIM